MVSSYSLRLERQNFYNLRDKLNQSIAKLNSAIDNFGQAKISLENNFTVNGETLDRKQLVRNLENFRKIGKVFSEKMLMEVNSKIDRLSRDIERAELEEIQRAEKAAINIINR